MTAQFCRQATRHLFGFLLAVTLAGGAAIQAHAFSTYEELTGFGYNTAAECDVAVAQGTANFYTAHAFQSPQRRKGEVDVKTIALRDLVHASMASARVGYRAASYAKGACDLVVERTDVVDRLSGALAGRWVAYSPDAKLNAYSDEFGVVVRVTLRPSDEGFAKGLPRPVGDIVQIGQTITAQSSIGAVGQRTTADASATPATAAIAAPASDVSAVGSACYATVVTPPRMEMRPEVVVKTPATKRQEVVPATYRDVVERVLVSPEHKRQIPVPATYKTVYEEVVVRPATEREEPIPATYRTVTEQVLVKAESKRIEVTPPTYRTVSEQVVATPETKTMRVIPATFMTEERRVIDRSASTRVETVPPTFKTVTERVLVTPESIRYDPVVLPMKTVSEQVVVAPAGTRVESVPATYMTVTERVVSKEASKRLVEVPAEYSTVTESVKVADASKEWKRGRAWLGRALQVSSLSKLRVGADGTVNGVKVDLVTQPAAGKSQAAAKRRAAGRSAVGTSTGSAVSSDPDDDVMCLVEIPARYETITRQVVKKPASVREVELPAEYAAVTRQVLDKPATTRTLDIPAAYQTVTRQVIDVDQMKALGYTFDDHGDPMTSPSGERVLRAAMVQGAGATAQGARAAASPDGATQTMPASSGAASGREGYVREVRVPAVYRDQVRTVEDTLASVRTVDVPATYKTVLVKVEVTPSRTEEVVIPATYKTVTRQVVETPATSREVVIPAIYRTIERRAVETPASTRKIPVPAVTERVERRVVDVPAGVREETIPAVYQTISHRVIDQPASIREVEAPAVTETIYNRVQVAPATSSRRAVLCETNATTQKILELQRALKQAGFDPGPVDGRIGPSMVGALTRYQEAKGLPVDDGRVINVDTVKALGISPD